MRWVIREIYEFFRESLIRVVVIIAVVIAAIFLPIAFRGSQVSYPEDIEFYISAAEILNEYVDNPIAASVKYDDRVIQLTGVVEEITGDNDITRIYLTDEYFTYRIELLFTDDDAIEGIVDLNIQVGAQITIIGEVSGLDEGIIMNYLKINKCIIVE